MKPVSLYCILLIGSLTFPLNLWAASSIPIITSLPTSISNGQSIEISGSQFGAKSPAKPYLWATMNNGSLSPSTLGIITSWGYVNRVSLNSNEGVAQTGCAKTNSWDIYNQLDSDLGIRSVGFNWNDPSQKTYIFIKEKHNFVFTNQNWKTVRIWSRGFGSGNNFYVQAGNRCMYSEGIMTSCQYFPNGFKLVQAENQWNTQEYILQSNSSSNIADGSIKFYSNGLYAFGSSALKLYDGSTLMSYLIPANGVIEAFNAVTNNALINYDDIYVDNTWSRVVIGDQPTYSASTHREIQIPYSWDASGTAIGIVVNQGTFANGTKAYLFVIDSDGNISDGKEFTFVNSSGAPPPINTLNKSNVIP
jgi:hypothetical protein